MAVQAAATAPVSSESIIKVGEGDTLSLPDLQEIETFTSAKCAKYAQELQENGLLDGTDLLPANFADMKLADKREQLIKATKVIGGLEEPTPSAGDAKKVSEAPKTVDLDEALAKNSATSPETSLQPGAVQTSAPTVDEKEAKKAEKEAKKAAKAAKKSNQVVDGSTHEGVEDDPIAIFAQKIEKVNSRAEIEDIVRDLVDSTERNDFMIGGALARVQENEKWWNENYESLRDYIETAYGLKYRRAMYSIELYNKVLLLGVAYSAFDDIGWCKVLLLTKIITKETLAEWVEKAKHMTVISLEAAIEAELAKAKGETPPEEKAATTTMSFKVHPDQKEVISTAIDTAMKQVPTAVKTVALEAIAQSYMGTGIAFKKWQDALTYAAKHASDKPMFVGEVVGMLETLCPELMISVAITQKDEPVTTAL